MRRLASLVMIAALAALTPSLIHSQQGPPQDAPKRETPKTPPKDSPAPGKEKDAPERRERMKQRDKEVDRIMNRKGKR